MERIQYFNRRLGSLKNQRSTFDARWQTLLKYTNPSAARFITSNHNRGESKNQDILNDTATNAVRTVSSGMMGGLTSPAKPWALLRLDDPDLNEIKPIRVWLDTVRQRMFDVFLRSNLYQALPILYSEVASVGTSAFALMEDEETVIRCYPAPIGSYYLGTSARGSIDAFAREFQMTNRQLVEKFGVENCSIKVQDAYKNQKAEDVWVDVVHFVERNPDYKENHPASKYAKFRSVYYEQTSNEDKFLEELGFEEFPIMCARWGVTGEDVYGTQCPGMQALGDIKMLQKMERNKMEMLAQLTRPTLQGPATLKNGFSMVDGGYIPVPAGDIGNSVRAVREINPYLTELGAETRQVEARINRAFFADLFLMAANLEPGQYTATEINMRREEKMLMLGPVLERLNDELFDPLIKRTFGIMWRKGLIPDPPPELAQVGAKLSVEYVSILAQAQKLIGVMALEKLTNYVLALMNGFPEAADKLDFDEAIEQYAGMVGAGPKTTRDAKQLALIRAQKAQAAQAAQTMEAMQAGAGALKSFGDTPVTSDKALGLMLERMGAR